MSVPLSQMWAVSKYVVTQRLKGRKRYPLVLMLEPLFRCNLSCAGCGKIQHPPEVLKKTLTVEECLAAADECGAPIVSIAGGEPLLHPRIKELVEAFVARKLYVYLCTNALLLKEKLDLFTPSKYLSLSIHLDGLKAEHDAAVCREGVFEKAVEAIREALKRGFRVTTNTTFFNTADPERAREFFDFAMELGIEGMMISPGYDYEKARDKDHFLKRQETINLFRRILHNAGRTWIFNHSPLFLEFITGAREFECTPWGNPSYTIFGWQQPCYLLEKGHVRTFKELMENTNWEAYGRKSGNPECAHCMVHCGYEPTAVNYTFTSLRGFLATLRAFFLGPRIPAPAEEDKAQEKEKSVSSPVSD